MGLVVILVIQLYILISLGIVAWAVSYAKKNDKSAIIWGLSAAFVMYLIPFWDWLPSVMTHKYYCSTNSGFFVYKSIEKWEEENPGTLKNLSKTHLPEQYLVATKAHEKIYNLPDGTVLTSRFNVQNQLMDVEYKKANGESGVQLNERFRRNHISEGPELLKVARAEIIITDSLTNQIMARQVDFRMATKGSLVRGPGDSGWRFWFQSDHRGGCFYQHPERFPNGGIYNYIQSMNIDCPNVNVRDSERDGVKISCP